MRFLNRELRDRESFKGEIEGSWRRSARGRERGAEAVGVWVLDFDGERKRRNISSFLIAFVSLPSLRTMRISYTPDVPCHSPDYSVLTWAIGMLSPRTFFSRPREMGKKSSFSFFPLEGLLGTEEASTRAELPSSSSSKDFHYYLDPYVLLMWLS